MSNINIEIPNNLHKEIKLAAVKGDISLKEFIIRSLEKRVNKNRK